MRLACLKLEVFRLSKLMFRVMQKKPFSKTWISWSPFCGGNIGSVSHFGKAAFTGMVCSQKAVISRPPISLRRI